MSVVKLKDLPEGVQLAAVQLLSDQIKSMAPSLTEDCEPARKLARNISSTFIALYEPPLSSSTQSDKSQRGP